MWHRFVPYFNNQFVLCIVYDLFDILNLYYIDYIYLSFVDVQIIFKYKYMYVYPVHFHGGELSRSRSLSYTHTHAFSARLSICQPIHAWYEMDAFVHQYWTDVCLCMCALVTVYMHIRTCLCTLYTHTRTQKPIAI